MTYDQERTNIPLPLLFDYQDPSLKHEMKNNNKDNEYYDNVRKM